MRVFRIAVPASRIDRARAFDERLLEAEADDTVPSRLYLCVVDDATLLLGRGAAWS